MKIGIGFKNLSTAIRQKNIIKMNNMWPPNNSLKMNSENLLIKISLIQ